MGGRTVILFAFILASLACSWQSCKSTGDLHGNESVSGAVLWTYHCSRCHDLPNPGPYSAAQWEVVGSHMQQRAMINGEEIKKIVLFLQSMDR